MKWLTEEQVMKILNSLLRKTGGLDGVRDRGLLDLSLNSPFQTFDGEDLYKGVLDKASQLCYSLIKNHPFNDGNKRSGVHLMLTFLELNQIKLTYSEQELVDLGLSVASGKFSKDDVLNWINSH